MFPLIPVIASASVSLASSIGGYTYVKYVEMDSAIKLLGDHTAQLQLSAEAASKGSLWGELLEPVARHWGGALKIIAYSLCAVSVTVIVVGIGAWVEIRLLRSATALNDELKQSLVESAANEEIRQLQAENAELKRELAALRRCEVPLS